MAFSIPLAKKPKSLYSVHDGPVHTVQRSPFYNDIILTVGGWNVAIWKEGVMVSSLQVREWAYGPLLLRKRVGTMACSEMRVPLRYFLEKWEQMAWTPACQQVHCKSFENTVIWFFSWGKEITLQVPGSPKHSNLSLEIHNVRSWLNLCFCLSSKYKIGS